jgi:hypothetical protein
MPQFAAAAYANFLPQKIWRNSTENCLRDPIFMFSYYSKEGKVLKGTFM